MLATIGPDLLVTNLPTALRPADNLFYYDASTESAKMQQAAIAQTGKGTFINGLALHHLDLSLVSWLHITGGLRAVS